MSKYNANELEVLNKVQLRELCRTNGIGYNGMNNEGMRAALLTVPGGENVQGGESVVEDPLAIPAFLQGSAPLAAPAASVPPPPPAPVQLPTAPAPVVTATPRKVQSGRPERNGVKRPSEGTICAQIWAWCDAEHDATGKVAAKDLRAALPQLDDTTKTVQFYRWRKFQGIQGRV